MCDDHQVRVKGTWCVMIPGEDGDVVCDDHQVRVKGTCYVMITR